MSRRKQAKPRSFKPEVDTDSCDENISSNISPYEATLLDNQDASVGDLAEIDYSSPLSQNNLLVRLDTNDSLESDDLGTDQETSWFSATPENSQASPVPSSCATPNSISDLPDAELSFTVGITENTQYGCSFCNKAFPRLSFLKKHEQIHSDQMPFRCEFCSRLFKHKRSRDRHVKLHTGDKKYRCLHCVAAFSRSDHLKIHMKTHDTEKPFKCKICNRGYNTAAALTSHIQNHKKQKLESCSGSGSTGQESSTANTSDEHTSSPENFPCKHCGECFQNMDYLQNHLSSNHLSDFTDRTNKLVSTFLNLSDPTVPEIPQITTKLACIYCTKDIFNTMEQLQTHVQLMHRSILNGEMCDYTFNDINKKYSPHNKVQTRSQNCSVHENYSCDICNIQFNSVQRLHKHNLIVHRNYLDSLNKPNYMCMKCTVPFQSSHMFTEHYLRVHENSLNDLFLMSPVLEQDLNKFNNRKAKRQCIEGVDVKVNQYEHTGTLLCNQCDAALPNFESFRSHLKSHLEQTVSQNDTNIIFDEKVNSYSCPHCTVSFKELDDYEQHALSHFLATTVEYECKCCTKSFSTSDELQTHLMDRHADHIYRCALCKEMFDSKVAIQVHFAVKHSTGSKFYRCVACPYESVLFNSKLEFSIHVRTTHGNQNPVVTNNKSIRCMFCRQRFNTDIEMQFHLTSHSKQFHCPICPEKFQIEFLLDRHMEMFHSNSQIINKTVSMDEKSNKSDISSNTPALHSPPTPKLAKTNNENNNVKKAFDIFDCEVYERTDFPNEDNHSNNNQIKKQPKHSNVSLHCAYCGETCKSRTDIENHLKHHSQGGGSLGKYKCNICDELCSSAIFLAEHKLTHCKIVSGNNCTHCKTTLTNKEQFYLHLIQHSNNNNNQAYKSQVVLPTPCVICRQTLMSDVEVKIHSQYHLNNTLQQYECSICLKLTENKNIIVSNTNNYVCKDCYSSTGLLDFTFRCSSCGIVCSKKLSNDSKICVKCQNMDSEKDNTDNTHECHLCRRLFSKPLELQSHLIEHTFAGCGSYTCYLCSAVFTAAQGLQNHILEHGLGARPYDCPKCNIKFFFRAELDNHNYIHLNENDNINEDEKFNFLNQEECVSPEIEQKVNCKDLNFTENFREDIFIKQEPEENNENLENGE